MPRALRISLFALGGVAAVLALAVVAVLLFVDVDSYKPRVEAMASSALGMDATVEGRLRIGLISGLHVAVEKVRIRNRGTEFAFVEEADLEIDLRSLVRRELRYGNVVLKRARISVERGTDGHYNYEKPPAAAANARGLDLGKVSFTDLVVVYRDRMTGNGLESRNCNGELTRLRHPGGGGFLARLSLSGQFACSELRGKDTAASDLKFSVEATDGVFDFKPVTMRLYGGQGSGTMRMDRSAAVPVLHLSYSLSKFRIEDYFKALPPGKSASGRMDFSITLAMRGRTRGELRRSADGEMELSGVNLILAGADLDRSLSKYESSQNFSLVDLGAFAFAGPIGLAVTKGLDFASLVQEEGGSTPIRTLVSRWRVVNGVAYARDVALTTRENRLALQGRLDFVGDEFEDVVVALVDAKGCAKVRQRVRGPFTKPVVEKPGVLASLTGPVTGLFGKARDLIPGAVRQCDVFYKGSVAPPKPD